MAENALEAARIKLEFLANMSHGVTHTMALLVSPVSYSNPAQPASARFSEHHRAFRQKTCSVLSATFSTSRNWKPVS